MTDQQVRRAVFYGSLMCVVLGGLFAVQIWRELSRECRA